MGRSFVINIPDASTVLDSLTEHTNRMNALTDECVQKAIEASYTAIEEQLIPVIQRAVNRMIAEHRLSYDIKLKFQFLDSDNRYKVNSQKLFAAVEKVFNEFIQEFSGKSDTHPRYQLKPKPDFGYTNFIRYEEDFTVAVVGLTLSVVK